MENHKHWNLENAIEQKLSDIPSDQFDKLKSDFKVLTHRDLLLLSLLLARINTRQIALYLNIKSNSVKKAKHRLRKKLRLSASTGWNDFFIQRLLRS